MAALNGQIYFLTRDGLLTTWKNTRDQNTYAPLVRDEPIWQSSRIIATSSHLVVTSDDGFKNLRFDVYDPAADTWTTVASLQAASLKVFSVAVLGDEVHVLIQHAGYDSSIGFAP